MFYVDETEQHGLVMTLDNVASKVPWFQGCNTDEGEPTCPWTLASGNGLGAGSTNTALMIAAQAVFNPTAGTNAGQLAASYVVDATTGKPTESCSVVLDFEPGPFNIYKCVGH